MYTFLIKAWTKLIKHRNVPPFSTWTLKNVFVIKTYYRKRDEEYFSVNKTFKSYYLDFILQSLNIICRPFEYVIEMTFKTQLLYKNFKTAKLSLVGCSLYIKHKEIRLSVCTNSIVKSRVSMAKILTLLDLPPIQFNNFPTTFIFGFLVRMSA